MLGGTSFSIFLNSHQHNKCDKGADYVSIAASIQKKVKAAMTRRRQLNYLTIEIKASYLLYYIIKSKFNINNIIKK